MCAILSDCKFTSRKGRTQNGGGEYSIRDQDTNTPPPAPIHYTHPHPNKYKHAHTHTHVLQHIIYMTAHILPSKLSPPLIKELKQ